MIAGAVFERPERSLHLEPAECRDQLVGVGRSRLGDAGGERVDGVVADHRAQPRIVVPAFLICGDKRLVRRRVDRLPGIAGDRPSDRRLLLERIEIFRLAGEQADDGAVLERAAGRALAHQLGEVRSEQDVEDGVGLGVVDCLHHGAGIDLAERRRLLGHELDVRLGLLQHLLEPGGGGLAVLEVGIDDGPALLLRRKRRRHQHRHLHVGRGAQPERVFVSVLPGDLVGEGFGREEEHLLLAGELGDREPDMGEERAGDDIHALAGDELIGDAHGVTRRCAIVAGDDLEFLAEHAPFGVDFLDRELPAFPVGLEEGRLRLVAVELADLDRGLGDGRRAETNDHGARRGQRKQLGSGAHAVLHFTRLQ